MEVYIYTLLTLSLDGDERSDSHTTYFAQREKPQYLLDARLDEHHSSCDAVVQQL
jgi:hypothetical protein